MNKVILCGRLTRDPETRYSKDNNAVSKYTLAVDRKFKREGEPDADFFNCTVFGKGAEFAEKYFKQGTKILVSGRIQNDNYTNRDGQKVYSVKVLVDEQEFAEGKKDGETKQQKSPEPRQDSDGFMNIPDGIDADLPFN